MFNRYIPSGYLPYGKSMINGGFNKFHDYDFEKFHELPSGKRLHNYGKSHFFMGKLTISIVIFPMKKCDFP